MNCDHNWWSIKYEELFQNIVEIQWKSAVATYELEKSENEEYMEVRFESHCYPTKFIRSTQLYD